MSQTMFHALHTHSHMSLVFPDSIEGMSAMMPLLKAEKAEFESVLGIPVAFVEQRPDGGPAWVIGINPDRETNELTIDRETLTLTSRAKDIDGVGTTLNLLHSLAGLDVDTISDAPHGTIAGVRSASTGKSPGHFLAWAFAVWTWTRSPPPGWSGVTR